MDDIIKRINKNEYYLNIARAVSCRSTCLRRHYGAVIVNNDEIVSTGYNGAPRGEIDCYRLRECNRNKHNCPKGSGYLICPSVHAEQNAIISARRRDMQGGILYIVGTSPDGVSIADPRPCTICRRLMVNAGIERCYGLDPDMNVVQIMFKADDLGPDGEPCLRVIGPFMPFT